MMRSQIFCLFTNLAKSNCYLFAHFCLICFCKMKKRIKSFVTFTRAERIGYVALSVLLLLLIAVRATMSLWVHPQINADDQKRLAEAWETFKRSQPVMAHTNDADTGGSTDEVFYKGSDPIPDTINLNKADSALLVRIKGIGPVTAHRILARIKGKGPFTDINQLKEVGRFDDAAIKVLSKHLVVE
jgi:DNA uptake protein ComE-like DNA-binding protein